MRDAIKTVGTLADKCKHVTICYVDEEGYPICREMLAPRARESNRVFYFTTNTSSKKVAHFRKHNKASIYFVDARFFRGIHLIGEMKVLEDKESKEMIWLDTDTMYYPLGVDDPDYCVLKFVAHKGNYYANFKNENFMIE